MITASLPVRQVSLWRSVVKLFRLRLLLFYMNFKRAKTRRKVGYVVLGIVILAALGGIFALSWGALALLRSPSLAQYFDPIPLLRSVPVLILTSAFVGLVFTSFGVLLQALYLANDMDFLLSAPVPMRAVFITKLVQAILPNFSLILLFGLPVLYGLGLSAGYPLAYFILVPVIFLAVALSAAGLSSLLVMGIVRIFPARRVAEVLAFLGAIFSFLCSQSGQLSNRMNFSETQVANAAQSLTQLDSPWNPLAWAGHGLIDLSEGRWLLGLGGILLSLGLASGIFYLALSVAERLYYTGWARIQIGTRRRKAVRQPAAVVQPGRKAAPLAWLTRQIPAPVRGLVVKDWLVLRRDLRNMSQLITPLIFGLIYSVFLFRGNERGLSGSREIPGQFGMVLSNLLVYANVGISLFVGWTLQSRLALMGFSQEGKSYWLLKTSPLKPWRLLLAKYSIAYLPTLIIGWLFLWIITIVRQGSLETMLFGMGVVALSTAGAVGLNLAFGVAGANFKWEDARQMMRGTTSCLAAIASMAYLFISLAAFFGPPILVELLGGPAILGQIAGLVVGGLIGLLCAIIPLRVIYPRVEKIGEE